MKRILTWLIGAVIALVVVVAAILYLAPAQVVAFTQWQAAKAAGLSSKTITLDGYEVHYYEGGTGPNLVMLHGMADDRNSFVATAAAFTDRYHVILPDLMGHGNNAADPDRDYSIAGQEAFVAALVDALGLDHFDLVGNSMGGHISAAYTLAHPQEIDKLILVDAPGLVVDDTVVYGGFGAPLQSNADFDAVMARVLYNPPSLPAPIKQYLIKKTNARVDFINGLANSVRNGEDYDLLDRIGQIAAPTLILWGKEDVVVPFAVAEAYVARIPNAELAVLPEAGHSPQMEAPDRVAAAIDAFLAK
jgi:pimeloyl-ACP methyl ester carboxylesterase